MTAGQAGGRVACRACGREIDVPRLRDLATYAAESPAAEASPPSPRGRGLLITGAAVMVASSVLALALVPIGSMVFPQPASIREIRAAVDAASMPEISEARRLMARGVARPATAEERRLQKFVEHASGLTWLLWGVAGLGAIVAAAGAAWAAAAKPAARKASR